MHDNFVDWYRHVDPDPREETLQKRWNGIKEVLSRTDLDTYLDLIRIFVGVPLGEVRLTSTLNQVFKSRDTTFSVVDNQAMLQVLAGSALLAVWTATSPQGDVAALALISADCHGAGRTGPLRDALPAANRYLAERGRAVRTEVLQTPTEAPKVTRPQDPTGKIPEITLTKVGPSPAWPPVDQNFASVDATMDGVVEAVKKTHENLVRAIDQLTTLAQASSMLGIDPRVPVLQEETDILWWLFGRYSIALNVPLASLQGDAAALVVGRDLAKLTRLIPGHIAARSFLDRALTEAGISDPHAAQPLGAGVDATPRDWREQEVGSLDLAPLIGLTPVLHAVASSLTTDEPGAWAPAYRRAHAIDPDATLPALDLSEQIYLESLLARVYAGEG